MRIQETLQVHPLQDVVDDRQTLDIETLQSLVVAMRTIAVVLLPLELGGKIRPMHT